MRKWCVVKVRSVVDTQVGKFNWHIKMMPVKFRNLDQRTAMVMAANYNDYRYIGRTKGYTQMLPCPQLGNGKPDAEWLYRVYFGE